LSAALGAMQTALQGLANGSDLSQFTATASGTGLTATTTAGAVAGSFQIGVTQVATNQALTSSAFGASTTLGTGTMNISIGGQSMSLNINSSNNTLSGIASAINSSASNPGVTATILELSQERIETQLLADEIDLGIAFDQPHLAAVHGTPLFTETLVAVFGSTTPAAPLTPEIIGQHSLALLTPDFATRVHVDAYFAQHGVKPRIAIETNSLETLTEIVRHSPLATVLPDAIIHTRPYLFAVALDPPLSRAAILLTREGAYRTAAAHAFIRLAEEYVRAHPPD